MSATQPQPQPGKKINRLEVLFLLPVVGVLWLARVPYRLREIEARQCDVKDEPKLPDIFKEFCDAFHLRVLDAAKPFSPHPIQAKNEDALKTILELNKESVKNGFDRFPCLIPKLS
jgi:hypothetical protein